MQRTTIITINQTKLKALRETANLSQEKLAEVIGMSARTLQNYETEGREFKNQPPIYLARIADHFKIPQEDLYTVTIHGDQNDLEINNEKEAPNVDNDFGSLLKEIEKSESLNRTHINRLLNNNDHLSLYLSDLIDNHSLVRVNIKALTILQLYAHDFPKDAKNNSYQIIAEVGNNLRHIDGLHMTLHVMNEELWTALVNMARRLDATHAPSVQRMNATLSEDRFKMHTERTEILVKYYYALTEDLEQIDFCSAINLMVHILLMLESDDIDETDLRARDLINRIVLKAWYTVERIEYQILRNYPNHPCHPSFNSGYYSSDDDSNDDSANDDSEKDEEETTDATKEKHADILLDPADFDKMTPSPFYQYHNKKGFLSRLLKK